jgi:hypothetical protein
VEISHQTNERTSPPPPMRRFSLSNNHSRGHAPLAEHNA